MGTAFLAGVLVLTGATSGLAGPAVAPLARLSPPLLDRCGRSALLRPVCPRLVPAVSGYRSYLAVELAGGASVLDVFDLEYGGEYPRNPERNRPPRMAHVVVVAGTVGRRLVPFREPSATRGKPVRDGILRARRTRLVSFGQRRWADRLGVLYVAPAYPTGGVLGNHLVFSWRQLNEPYALSLHAWEPLTESAATLQRMMEALPSVTEAGRLARLSPSRRLTLRRGPGIADTRVEAPYPDRRAFDVYAVASGRAEIGLWIESADRERLRVVDSTRRCSLRIPLRICFVRIPRAHAPRGGLWTIVAAKRSDPAARIRVDLRFR